MRTIFYFLSGFTIVSFLLFSTRTANAQLFPKCTLFSTYICSGGSWSNSNLKTYVTGITVDYENATIIEETATTTDWLDLIQYCSLFIRYQDGQWGAVSSFVSVTRADQPITPPPNDFEDAVTFHPATFNVYNPEGCYDSLKLNLGKPDEDQCR